jgi:hypothetical protein
MNPVHIFATYYIKINSNIIFLSNAKVFRIVSYLQVSRPKFCTYFSPPPRQLHARSTHLPWFMLSNIIWSRGKVILMAVWHFIRTQKANITGTRSGTFQYHPKCGFSRCSGSSLPTASPYRCWYSNLTTVRPVASTLMSITSLNNSTLGL